MEQAERLIKVAESFLGVKESPAGSNNVIFNTHFYSRKVSGSAYPWCMAFVWDVFRLAGLSKHFFGGGKTASCASLLAFAKASGQLASGAARRGDIVLYRFGRTGAAADHTGIVTWSDGKTLRAIEGNTSAGDDSNGGEVLLRTRGYDNVAGIVRIAYEEEENVTYEDFEHYMERYLSISGTGNSHSAWAAAAIDAVRSAGIVAGGGDGDFGWKKPVTKETVAQMLCNCKKSCFSVVCDSGREK